MATLKIAFEPPEIRPGGAGGGVRPIDLAQLGRQTMGDKNLEAEVLKLFAREARSVIDTLSRDPAADARALAHRLKGAARAVGAVSVASAAEGLESEPGDSGKIAILLHAVAETENFICGLLR